MPANDLRARLVALRERFDALQPRERLIIAGAGLILIGLAWYALFAEPVVQHHDRLRGERAAVATQLADLDARIAQAAGPAGTDPRRRLAELEQRAAGVEERIQGFAAELIGPTQMARVLERMLERRPALRLERLHNLGAEDLLPQDTPGQNRLYRHRLVIELEGPYLAVLAYLEDLEALPWRLYWLDLVVEATGYPLNRVRIEVATLSLQEDWIGV